MQAALRRRLEAWRGKERPKNLAEARQMITQPSSLQCYTGGQGAINTVQTLVIQTARDSLSCVSSKHSLLSVGLACFKC
jgi:hypothetical protein